jgi:thiamine-phosphate diphosphorylase
MTGRPVPRLHLISDSRLCDLGRFPAVARRAAEAGVDAVHLREKDVPAVDLLRLAIELRNSLGKRALLVINDRIDVAQICDAGGVQLGERSLPVGAVRGLLGADVLIGRSVHDVEGARKAEADGADFVVAGHVYETSSKLGQAGRGPEFIEAIVQACSLPVIAIGGITPEHVPEVARAGAHGVAVISGILSAPDPAAASRAYANALRGGVEPCN